MEVVVDVVIGAPRLRVWRALTDTSEVCRWTGLEAVDVPGGYPAPGQHARWGMRFGPVTLTLHDRVVAVEPPALLAAQLAVAFVRVDEEYRLDEGPGGTLLVSRNVVQSTVSGLGPMARALVARDVRSSLAALVEFCQGG